MGRYGPDEIAEPSLAVKATAKGAGLENPDHSFAETAGQKHAATGPEGEGDITRRSAEDGSKALECMRGQRLAFGGGVNDGVRIRKCWGGVMNGSEGVVETDEAWTGEDALDRHPAKAGAQPAQDFDFLLIFRRKSDMAAFASQGDGLAGLAHQRRGTKTGAGTDKGDGGIGPAWHIRADALQIIVIQRVGGGGQSAKIINQANRSKTESRQSRTAHVPAEIGENCLAVIDRACDGQYRHGRRCALACQIVGECRFKAGVIGRGKVGDVRDAWRSRCRKIGDGKAGIGTADVADNRSGGVHTRSGLDLPAYACTGAPAGQGWGAECKDVVPTMKLAVLTGGGDVPGLNVTIKTIVERAAARGWSVTGIRRGWLGLLAVDPASHQDWSDWLRPLSPQAVRDIGRDGGTVLHTSRLEPQQLPEALAPAHLKAAYEGRTHLDATPFVLDAIATLGFDAIIAIGGDGTLRFAARLAAEGVPVVSIPKTMDNDVFGTDYAIGFSTAITRSVDAISALRTTAASHERILIVELFGRLSGQTALYTGLLADADRTFIAEVPFDAARAGELLEADRLAAPSRSAVAVISEGARVIDGHAAQKGAPDAYGRRRLGGIGEVLGQACARVSPEGVIVQNLAYLMRSGPPDATDRQVAHGFGALAVELLGQNRSGRMCAVSNGCLGDVAIDTLLQGQKRVDVARAYDTANWRPHLSVASGLPLFGF